jgi:hypothetical protein
VSEGSVFLMKINSALRSAPCNEGCLGDDLGTCLHRRADPQPEFLVNLEDRPGGTRAVSFGGRLHRRLRQRGKRRHDATLMSAALRVDRREGGFLYIERPRHKV